MYQHSMIQIEQVIGLNNEGVYQLHHGNIASATISFNNSLTAIKQLIRLHAVANNNNNANISQTPSPLTSMSPHTITSSTQMPGSLSTAEKYEVIHSLHPLPILKREGCFLYKKAVTLRMIDRNDKQAIDLALRMYAGCVVLNLALLYHCRAEISDDDGTDNQIAEKLYDIIPNLVKGIPNSGINNLSTVLALAAVNNASQIRFKRRTCHQSQDSDLKMLTFLIDSFCGKVDRTGFLNEQEINGVFSNLLLLSCSPLDTAAPAA